MCLVELDQLFDKNVWSYFFIKNLVKCDGVVHNIVNAVLLWKNINIFLAGGFKFDKNVWNYFFIQSFLK